MTNQHIRFDDGAAYENYMGVWSQIAGKKFLDWLAPKPNVDWLDIGCGNGAFTELVAAQCAPRSLQGIDPAPAQISFAQTRPALRAAKFQQGDAMALPFSDDKFDVAVMPLVIFFIPDPAQGVAEATRVVRSGGLVSAYAWDMPGNGFPYAVLQSEIRALGVAVPVTPNPDASKLDVLHQLWTQAGLTDVESTVIHVERTFASMDEYWEIVLRSPSAGASITSMPADRREVLKTNLRARLSPDQDGRIHWKARAHAIKGRVSK